MRHLSSSIIYLASILVWSGSTVFVQKLSNCAADSVSVDTACLRVQCYSRSKQNQNDGYSIEGPVSYPAIAAHAEILKLGTWSADVKTILTGGYTDAAPAIVAVPSSMVMSLCARGKWYEMLYDAAIILSCEGCNNIQGKCMACRKGAYEPIMSWRAPFSMYHGLAWTIGEGENAELYIDLGNNFPKFEEESEFAGTAAGIVGDGQSAVFKLEMATDASLGMATDESTSVLHSEDALKMLNDRLDFPVKDQFTLHLEQEEIRKYVHGGMYFSASTFVNLMISNNVRDCAGTVILCAGFVRRMYYVKRALRLGLLTEFPAAMIDPSTWLHDNDEEGENAVAKLKLMWQHVAAEDYPFKF